MSSATFIDSWLINVMELVKNYFIISSLVFVLFYIIFRKQLWFRKIQKKIPMISDYSRDIFFSVSTMSIVATIALVTFFYLDTNIYGDIFEYSWVYYVFTWFWMFFIHDTYFYWLHRLMHHPALFKRVHIIHHKSTNPSPWSAYAFHPIEGLLSAGILPIIACTMPVHNVAFGIFNFLALLHSVYAHLGFELLPKGFHKNRIGKWYNTSVAHNLHHEKFDGHYGLYFLFWDRIMGTVRDDYNEFYERITQSEKTTVPTESKPTDFIPHIP